MGHLVGKDIYNKLGNKLENLTYRAPYNKAMYDIVKELYTLEEAELIVKMPDGIADIKTLVKITGYPIDRLQILLEKLCSKGLVFDLQLNGKLFYVVSPMIIGFFELTMMRTGENLNSKEWARLFSVYLDSDDLYKANFGKGMDIGFSRAVPHDNAFTDEAYVEVVDYQKVEALVAEQDKFAIGLCSCRHEKMHTGEKKCDIPVDNCSSFGPMADFVIRRNLAKEVSKTEALESIERSKEMGLVFLADNVKNNITYLCQCCGCCCNVMRGFTKFGYENIFVTSDYIAEVDSEKCVNCEVCFKACHVNAFEEKFDGEKTAIKVNKNCIGCGVCVSRCPKEAILFKQREKKVYVPEDLFEKAIVNALDKGVLQNHIFPNPNNLSHKALRSITGAFLRLPPVKKKIMSENVRSNFLDFLRTKSEI